MTINNITLDKLTGLSDQELSDVLAKNPRAYMAVKGAVAEKHLEKLLTSYKEQAVIKSFKSASGDFDKDFYVTLNNGKEITLECKNIQVLNTGSKKLLPEYIQFLVRNNYLTPEWLLVTMKNLAKSGVVLRSEKELNTLQEVLNEIISQKATTATELYKAFPQELRESGIPRYEFSSSLIKESDITKMAVDPFLEQFLEAPLTIDFQRTRNSTDKDGNTRKQRLYSTNEIDIVGACLFSRTMKWQFVFGHSKYFKTHKKYPDRYSNKLIIEPNKWSYSLLDCF
jgi:hypothetical protein